MKSRFFLVLALLITSNATFAQTTAFTYQGKLADNNGNALSGNYDFQFKLFDASINGNPIATLTFDGPGANPPFVSVANGIFNVTLDFVNCPGCNCPTCFNGAARFLEIAVKPHGGGSFPPPLTPRQPITSTPYAVKSKNAANATTADGLSVACVSCVTSSQIATVNGSAVTGTIPVASVPAGSNNYIQNTTSPPQASSDFNISGNGTADIFNAATQFNIAGSRILSNIGSNNLFVGVSAGAANTIGSGNAFFGARAGTANTMGFANAFFGFGAGESNTIGIANSFVGSRAGVNAAESSNNSFFGSSAGFATTFGSDNTFIGGRAGLTNTSGFLNTALGSNAGKTNTVGAYNTVVGESADVSVGSLTNATAIGSKAQVSQSNSLVLGSINLVNGATADTNVGIGTTAPSQRLHVVGNGFFTGTLNANIVNAAGQYNLRGAPVLGSLGDNLFVGLLTGGINTGVENSFVGTGAGSANLGGTENSFFGSYSGNSNISGSANAFFGNDSGYHNTAGNFNSFFGPGNGLTTSVGTGYFNTIGSFNSFFGHRAGEANDNGDSNSFFGASAGQLSVSGGDNTFLGHDAGNTNTSGSFNTVIGASADVSVGSLNNATAIGSKSFVSQSNSLVLGSINGTNGATADTRVGIGTTAPGYKLEIVDPGSAGLRVQTNTAGGTLASFAANGDFQIDRPGIPGGRFNVQESGNVGIGVQIPQDKLDVNGFVRLRTLASGPNFTTLCINNSSQISNCSSSIRYKTNIAKLSSSLTLINQLHPVTFNWKANNQPDVGLIAEEVAKVEPLLTFRNDKGEIEGMKYDRISVVLLNAIKEQQQQIEALKKLVCSSRRKAKACQ